jgi:hypothetical protein
LSPNISKVAKKLPLVSRLLFGEGLHAQLGLSSMINQRIPKHDL